MLQRG